jgi:hypothetical protein
MAFCRAGEPTPKWLPDGHQLYGHGKAALAAVLDSVGGRRTLHLPTYYCMDTAQALAGSAELAWYRELPDGRGPRLESLAARPGDVVLAQNLFGRARRDRWDEWSQAHPEVVVVEDHTHDPWSGWAMGSTADFCVASLRKTLPLPDGALAWSPRGRGLVPAARGADPGSALKLAAMLLKAAWLDGAALAKADFRSLQVRGEDALYVADRIGACEVTVATLPRLAVRRLREARARNAATLLGLLPDPVDAVERDWQLIGPGPLDCVPFGVQVVCRSARLRDALRAHLIAGDVFPAVHWTQSGALGSGDPDARDLGDRILTLPVDHRYAARDMEQLAGVIATFAH